MSRHLAPAAPAAPAEPRRAATGWPRALLLVDAAWRLGPRPVGLLLWHRFNVATGRAAAALGAVAAPPSGPFLPSRISDATAPGDAAALAVAARAAVAGGWYGPFDATAPALALDPHGAGDIRPVWERHRLAALPWLVMAARLGWRPDVADQADGCRAPGDTDPGAARPSDRSRDPELELQRSILRPWPASDAADAFEPACRPTPIGTPRSEAGPEESGGTNAAGALERPTGRPGAPGRSAQPDTAPAPRDGPLAAAEALLAGWAAGNPAFRGPAWACGQEAALRALHIALALALLDADREPRPAMRALLALHARRIAATRAYAMAQDNNHAVSEPAGLFVLGLVLRDAALAARGARDLARAVGRLVAEDGAFAQASPAYHRLLVDTLALAEWFRRRHGAPPLAAPFAARATAATRWLNRVTDPATGALPRCGPCDDSALADLSLRGPFDARGSLARAIALFGAEDPAWRDDPARRGTARSVTPTGADDPAQPDNPLRADLLPATEPSDTARDPGAGHAPHAACPAAVARVAPAQGGTRAGTATHRDADCAWLGLNTAGAGLPEDAPWRSEGWMGAARGGLRLLLRTGAPMRFRPGQEDALHLDLSADGMPLLVDGGTGAYTPPPGREWWTEALAGVAGHNTVQFDDTPQMPRAGRFLFARWPRCVALPDGATMTDHRGRRQERRFDLGARCLTVEDRLSGPFARAVLRWRLGPGDWHATPDGAEGKRARLCLSADAPCAIRLVWGWASPAYGVVRPAPVLELAVAAPVARIVTRVEVA